ncbi:MAG TPA: hypothetical protein VFF65_12930 [Phycisphaerales bacterium]|nr:hypothetical protein [Phycisphaerales bacterium]
MTPEELAVINTLASAWNQFVALPVQHKHEAREFMDGIHRLQDLIAARAGYRGLWSREDVVEMLPGGGDG